MAKEGKVDLIILDINMPLMNGVEFMGKIKENSLYRNIPIIVLSTEGKEEDMIKAQKAGAWAFVRKSKAEGLSKLIIDAVNKKPSPFLT